MRIGATKGNIIAALYSIGKWRFLYISESIHPVMLSILEISYNDF